MKEFQQAAVILDFVPYHNSVLDVVIHDRLIDNGHHISVLEMLHALLGMERECSVIRGSIRSWQRTAVRGLLDERVWRRA